MDLYRSFLPRDRAAALAAGTALPARAVGAVLLTDLSGFTPLTAALGAALGPQRGAEEITRLLNAVFEPLIACVHEYNGSVVGFVGDAITCWFPDDTGARAATCALAQQAALRAQAASLAPPDLPIRLVVKAAIASGPVHRFLVGDPARYQIEVLAGSPLLRMAAAEQQARPGEVVLSPECPVQGAGGGGRGAGDDVGIEWRAGFQVLKLHPDSVAPIPPPPARDSIPAPRPPPPAPDVVRPWLVPAIYDRLRQGAEGLLAELRPVVTCFVRFGDLDYDADPSAPAQLDAFVRHIQDVLDPHQAAILSLTVGDKGGFLHTAFGAPVVHRDDALRAVTAALTLRTLPAACAALGPPQIGLAAGRVWAGLYGGAGRVTYDVMGPSVNLAARLMQAAASGQVLVGPALAAALAGHFVLRPLPPRPLKGLPAPVAMQEVVAPAAAPVLGWSEPAATLPLVGRTAELAQITSALAVARTGSGQVLGLTGEAGIGKSRLAAAAAAQARAAGLLVAGGICQATGIQTPYLGWRAIWRGLAGLDPTQPVAAQVAQAATWLTALDPAWTPRLPLLGPMLDLPIPDTTLTAGLDDKLRKESREALLADCLRALVPRGAAPLVLVLEDCHWLDPLSQDLLTVLGRAVAHASVVLLLTYRPAPGATLATWPPRTEIALTALPDPDLAQMLAAKWGQVAPGAGTLPAALAAALVVRAEGNPFYLEELVNYLADRGIDPSDAVAVAGLELPTSLHRLILERIDTLPEREQLALKVASIIGRVFRVDWLAGYYPALGGPGPVRAALEDLARLDITPLDTPEPDLAYLFKHSVTQEVAYESLAYSSRATLHEQLAAWLEAGDPADPSTGSGQALDLLAYHYGRSHNATKQREYFQKAGDAAAARYANTAAVEYYQRLLEVLPWTDHGAVRVARGGIFQRIAAWDAAIAEYEAVLGLPAAHAPAALRRQAQHGLGTVARNRGRYDEALAWLTAAQATDPTGAEGAPLLLEQAITHWQQGDMAAATTLAEASRAAAQAQGDQRIVARVLHLLGNVMGSRSEWEAARALWRESLALKRALGDQMGSAGSLVNLSSMAHKEGDLAQARALLAESLAIYDTLGATLDYGRARGMLGELLLAEGDALGAQATHRANIAVFRDLDTGWDLIFELCRLAEASAAASDVAALHYAVCLQGAATRLGAQFGSMMRMRPDVQAGQDRLLAQARQVLGEAATAAAWAAGEALTWEEAIAYALDPHRIDTAGP